MTKAEQLVQLNHQAINSFIATKCAKLLCGMCDKPDWQSGGFHGLTHVWLQPDMIGEEIERSLSSGVNAEGVVVAVTWFPFLS